MGTGGLPLRTGQAGVSLPARVTPKSACDSVDGVVRTARGSALKVRVRAAADRGKANAAVEELVARWLGLARMRVRIAQGGKSRVKILEIEGEPDELEALISRRVAALC